MPAETIVIQRGGVNEAMHGIHTLEVFEEWARRERDERRKWRMDVWQMFEEEAEETKKRHTPRDW
jgi:hypothetical protein